VAPGNTTGDVAAAVLLGQVAQGLLAEPGASALRTRPLEALIIGGWVRGLSDRAIESLVAEAGLVCWSPTERRA
jgi:hypothetical protein